MQFPGQEKPPLGVVYNTTMSRPDAALALALIHGLEGKREARVAAIAVTAAGLGAAAFCDAVSRFYAGAGPPSNSNRLLPVGLAADGALPADPPMVQAALDRRNEKGEPVYNRGIHKIGDTSEVRALIRNALTAQADGNSVVLLSAPATYLARVLELPGTRELIAVKVKMLVISDSRASQDIAAARKLLAAWPTQIVLCGREIGEAFPFPAASIEKDFAWSPAHPIVDAYRAFAQMPYDAPSWDMAAVLYAIRSGEGFFQLSEPGTIEVHDDGSMKFAAGGAGKARNLILAPGQKEKIVQAYVEIASAKPVPRRQFRPPQKAAEVKPVDVKPAAK